MKKVLILFAVLAFVMFAQDKKAPDFMLEDLEGEYVELADVIGDGPVIVSFWATWCKPCVEEMKAYNKIIEEMGEKGVSIVAISVDSEKSVSKVEPFIKSHGYDFTVLLDTNGEIARKYYAQTVPHSVLLDKDGNIVYQHSGYKKGDEIEMKKEIEKLL